ncbi:ferredoxin reductase domain-containing protein [Phycisphaera mikurensis]|uniref:Putative oxidoreductase n=1 Tax=Phycisphaera mikurensis (strain NBRC 102666 / KCTC 22515 / FYK2301M01) TaxID=1142394 RepID=I0IIA2_PHYMF|nr:putative oxidoreductase [Phycisphaera mikurensis]MBB6442447.1 hypothetical protein [Phycisphaera mikurensis]BAM04990.1 putative oxidoreductase [Phycisphaera mikurensis NBRC 102666]
MTDSPDAVSRAEDGRYRVRILGKQPLNHNVTAWTVARPDGYAFRPGEACRLAVDADGWRDEDRPFTMSSLPDAATLEWVVKHYPEHEGMTQRMSGCGVGDTLLMGEPGGYFYDRGPGVFVAGGAGVTPFLAILRDLQRSGGTAGYRLLFSNSTAADVFLKDELDGLLGRDAIYQVTGEETGFADRRRIDAGYLGEKIGSFDQYFYLCGPPGFSEDLRPVLLGLGAPEEKIIDKTLKGK